MPPSPTTQDADPEDYRTEQRKLSMMRLRMQELQQGAAGMLVNFQGAVSDAADSLASSQPGSPRAAAAAAASAVAAAAGGMTASLTAVRQLLQQAQMTQKQQDLLLQLKRQVGGLHRSCECLGLCCCRAASGLCPCQAPH